MGMLLNRHRNRHQADAKASADASGAPEGKPTEKWTNNQIAEYAKAHAVDLAGATKKAEYLERIEAAEKAAADPASQEPADGGDDGQQTPTGADGQQAADESGADDGTAPSS